MIRLPLMVQDFEAILIALPQFVAAHDNMPSVVVESDRHHVVSDRCCHGHDSTGAEIAETTRTNVPCGRANTYPTTAARAARLTASPQFLRYTRSLAGAEPT